MGVFLKEAILAENTEMLLFALDHGALTDVKDIEGKKPIEWALRIVRPIALEVFLKAGASLYCGDGTSLLQLWCKTILSFYILRGVEAYGSLERLFEILFIAGADTDTIVKVDVTTIQH